MPRSEPLPDAKTTAKAIEVVAETPPREEEAAAELKAQTDARAYKLKAEKDANDASVATAVKLAAEILAAERRKSEFWMQLFVKVVLPIALAFIAYLQIKAQASISTQTARGERVEEKLDATHELVNSGSLLNLKSIASLAHWKADQTMLPADIRAAEEADKMVLEHMEKQKKSDATRKN